MGKSEKSKSERRKKRKRNRWCKKESRTRKKERKKERKKHKKTESNVLYYTEDHRVKVHSNPVSTLKTETRNSYE